MSPKDKAEELVEKFTLACKLYTKGKLLASICVDEIISACEYNNVESYNSDWWNKVKKEIQKL